MKLISFDAMRTFGIPNTLYVKPENAAQHLDAIGEADWLLFPEYWQVNSLYYGLRKPVYPSISTYHIGHDKIEMTRAVQLLWPRHMPETHILANTGWAREWAWENMDRPFVAKSIRAAMGQGVWLIENRDQWDAYAKEHEILYVQEYLPIDRDMRLVVIGSRVVAAYWRRQQAGGFHTNVSRGGLIDAADIPPQAVALVERMAGHLDIDHAGFDIARVDDHFYFFEFNRLFGTAGLIEQGLSPGQLIFSYLTSRSTPPLDPNLTPPHPDTPFRPKLAG